MLNGKREVNGSMLKRRDFTFHGLLAHEGIKELPLFSDLGADVFIPTPEKEYPPIHLKNASLSYTGIKKHQGENIGLHDTAITNRDAMKTFEMKR